LKLADRNEPSCKYDIMTPYKIAGYFLGVTKRLQPARGRSQKRFRGHRNSLQGREKRKKSPIKIIEEV
jgi:hypothetical protein